MRSGDTNKYVGSEWLTHPVVWRAVAISLTLLLAGAVLTTKLAAQDVPPQRQLRTFIPPDQIVSFLPTTPFDQFIENLNPIFIQVTGKRVIDPESRTHPIQASIVGMQFFDAFELVLDLHRLRYRETAQYFIIEPVPKEEAIRGEEDAMATRVGGAPGEIAEFSATSREVEIEAVLFSLNHTLSRELGVDWSVFWGTERVTGFSEFSVKTGELFEPYDDWLIAPNEISFADLTRLFRVTEQEGLGNTVASPRVTVSSGKQGRIQIGSDIPVQVRDFAGNTITQFVSTGVIINVIPTVIRSPVADTTGAPILEFIHLDVRVERSSGRPFGGSVAIDRAGADTEILLLDGESTVIGGLYGTDVQEERTGIPILKDLPWWVFGLRYIFGNEARTENDNELLIAIRANLLDPLPTRAEQPFPNGLRDSERKQLMDLLRRFDARATEKYWPQRLRPYEEQGRNQGNPENE